MNHCLEAIYLVELQELLLAGGKCIRVPDQVAATVSPQMLDLRFVKRWAVMNSHLAEAAEIGVAA